jgi:hypothetical protein
MKEITIYQSFMGDVFDDFTVCLDAEFLELQYENRISCYDASFEKRVIDLDDLRNHNVDFIFVSDLLDTVVHEVFEGIEVCEGIPMPNLSTFPKSDLFIFDYAFGGWLRAEAVLEETKRKQAYLEEVISTIRK